MSDSPKWDDLAPRVASGAVMVVIGLLGVWLGGIWWHLLIAAITGVMVWELAVMLHGANSDRMLMLGGIAAAAAMLSIELPAGFALPLLLAPALVGVTLLGRRAPTYMIYTAVILLAGYGMMALRDDFGLVWMLWLVLVVIVTDVGGYFAGRMIGGPKFWPRVSPKKTWSGTVAGWICAGFIGAIFAGFTEAGSELIGISIAAAMASQMGDIAESAIKRRCGVKDSSWLIPGHGGLLDRFDGMLGAALFLLVVGQIVNFPPGVQ